VTSYVSETSVRSRLARTTISMEIDNALDCSSIHVITLQLPTDTRITSLKTIATDGCTTRGDVQELREARDTFIESASNGLPSAYVEAQDSSTHSLQVSMPPLGTTKVVLVVEQLLKQRLDEVKFEIPLAPNEKVDSVVFDLKVEDTVGEPVDFDVDLHVPGVYDLPDEKGNSTNRTDTDTDTDKSGPIHLNIPDARQYNIPQIIRGQYNPGKIPENGLLFTDGTCFEHFFHPSSLDPMPRNFVFLVETSSSMQHNSKMQKAKKALNTFIDTLKPDDTFIIQSFGNKGTERLWGSGPGTDEEKQEAKQFVDALKPSSYRTDLHAALLESLLRAKHQAEISDDNVATILVVISDGYASYGETNRTKIAEHVYDLNAEGIVKIFNLGFQGSADMQLLDAIALMNGGVSAPILQGKRDISEQITNFLDSEIGSVLMSDVNVKYSTGSSKETNVFGETQKVFPVMADGYEVVVRGLIREPDSNEALNAVTSASTMEGMKNWELSAMPNSNDVMKSSLCFQSYAHDRITQLLGLYDASGFLGNELLKKLVTLSDKCEDEDFAKCIRGEALALAIKANVVAKGLTAMVTLDDDQCMEPDEDAEICLDGTTPDGTKPQDDDDYYYYDSYDGDHVESGHAHADDAHTDEIAVPDSAYDGGFGGGYSDRDEDTSAASFEAKSDSSYRPASAPSYPRTDYYNSASAPQHSLVYSLVLFSTWFFMAVRKLW